MLIESNGSVPIALRRTRPAPAPLELMPEDGPLVDSFGRVHDDLRISITDRCNLRCVYCMAEDGVQFSPHADLLTIDEIGRLAKIAAELGVNSVRITGGEPLVRRGVVELVERLATLGFDDIALTTNGMALERLASPLAAAGLTRVNVSCDSLHAGRFAAIRRRGELSTVLRAMDAAEAAGLSPLKVNVVLMAGENEDEILEFADFARQTGRVVRFIEFMPLDADGAWRRDLVIAGAEVLARIGAVWPLAPVESLDVDPAPASRFRFLDGIGEIGIVASVTQPFCGTCNRLRIMSDGSIRNCLFSDEEFSVRTLLRTGASDDAIARSFRQSVWGKLPGHGINDPGFLRPVRTMSMIGG